MRFTKLLAAASSLALLSSPVLAAEIAEGDVDAVIVTRLPTEPTSVLGLTVITDEEIDRSQAVFAADILGEVPGLSLSRNGGFGGVTTVRLRGAAGDKTLVLIDGVVQNDASSPNGGYDFAGLDLADIERIEVLQGPQGSLWGSDAIGGVISLTTRELNGVRLGLEGGSYSTLRGTASAGVANERFAVNGSLAGYRSDGVSKAANGTEDDGFESWTASVGGRVALGDRLSLDGRVRYNEFETDIDGYDAFFAFGDTPDRSRSESWSGFARLSADDIGGLDHVLTVSGYDLQRDNISSFPSSYEADRATVRYTLGRGGTGDAIAFVAGLERDETEASVSTGDTADLGAASVFGVLRWRPVEPLTLTGALRYDDPDDYDSETTARLSAAYAVGAGFTLQASWGQGFKVPTISQAVCDFCFPAGPSVGLEPEKADGWDLGASWRSADDRIFAQVTGYRLEVEDQISYGIGRYVNIDRTETTGVTAAFDAEFGPVTLKAAYAYTDAVDATTGARLLRVPEHSGSVSLGWENDRFDTQLTIRAEGEQADSNPSTFSAETRDGFVTADLTGGWKLNERITFTARIENLADEDYQESLGYGETGRAAYIGIRFRN
ncbi:MAG: TonB-dependent receptor [Caulobacter sp.]|jgi:vitamin B12 transporter|nr:TonB-dependent receptor [Caulobacter sp.]